MAAIWALSAFCSLVTFLHLASTGLAIARCHRPRCPVPRLASPVSIVRPLCGLDNHIQATLESGFKLDHPCYELLLCVAHRDDPAVIVAQALIARYPAVSCRILVGDQRVSDNPKLNNIMKGWQAAAHAWIVIADSNVLMPHDYLARLMTAWQADTGLVCSPPIGTAADGLWAELECAFLNPYQARWQYAADSVGLGFAQGKTMLWRRDILDRMGGIRMLGAEIAEDAAATKLVRRAGLRVRLVDGPFPQPLGRRDFHDVWNRQLRWARLRRATFKPLFAAEILAGGLPPLIAAIALAQLAQWPVTGTAIAFAALWYGAESLLCRAAGWPLSWRTPALSVMRDALLPVLWIAGWLGNEFVWRGNQMRALEVPAIATDALKP